MSILIEAGTRILVQGLTGAQARSDAIASKRYGARIVAGVTPGRGGDEVEGIPVYDTVRQAVQRHGVDASVIYAPPLAVRDAVLEAVEARIGTILVTAEYVPVHDIIYIVAAARSEGVRLIGCNTNGVIVPGVSRLGGIGGHNPDEIYQKGRIGICSRSGGMSAEIALALRHPDLGVSTCVSMGGDNVTGTTMAEFVELFENDPQTAGIVIFGEPGTANERGVAELVRSGAIRKPVVALIVGSFQEQYEAGRSFGHAAAMISSAQDTATAKRQALAKAGVRVARNLLELPVILREELQLKMATA